MNWLGWPASEGIFSICEMPFSPWQPTQSSAFSLPAAMSAARAGAAANTKTTLAANQTNRLDIIILASTRRRLRLLLQATAASNGSVGLLAVADAIDRTGPVVGDEDR